MLKRVGNNSRHASGNKISLTGETLPTISLVSSSWVLLLCSVAFCSGKRLMKCLSLLLLPPTHLSWVCFLVKTSMHDPRSNFVYLSSLQKQSTRSFQHIWLNVHGGSFLWYKQLLYNVTMCCNRTKCLLPWKICSDVHLMGVFSCSGYYIFSVSEQKYLLLEL